MINNLEEIQDGWVEEPTAGITDVATEERVVDWAKLESGSDRY